MQTQLIQFQDRVNHNLEALLEKHAQHPSAMEHQFFDAIAYSTLNQGKRVRPALIYAIAEALNIPFKKVDSAACAIELIHSYSLVHDDLPAMDDDDLRRGRPTCHIQFDEATAILVGDAQQTLAFEILSNDQNIDPKVALEMIRLLSNASGAHGMIAGQVLDIQSEGKSIPLNTLKSLHLMKTGALIQCALLMGAANSSKYNELKPGLLKLGEEIGLAFQVQDDILDIESDTETLGKPQGSDIELDKSTYPKLMGIEKAKAYRDQLIKEAKQSLDKMQLSSEFLTALINYIAERKH